MSGKSVELLNDSFKEFFASSQQRRIDDGTQVDGYIVSDAGKDDPLQLSDHGKVVNNSLRVEDAAFCTFSPELRGFYAALRGDKTTCLWAASCTTLLSDFVEYSA